MPSSEQSVNSREESVKPLKPDRVPHDEQIESFRHVSAITSHSVELIRFLSEAPSVSATDGASFVSGSRTAIDGPRRAVGAVGILTS